MPFKDPAKHVAFINKRRRRLKIEAVASKGGKCEDCGFTGHPDCFDFHHRDPSEKEFEWRQVKDKSKAFRDAELAKCALLCANCHRLRHVRDYGGG